MRPAFSNKRSIFSRSYSARGTAANREDYVALAHSGDGGGRPRLDDIAFKTAERGAAREG